MKMVKLTESLAQWLFENHKDTLPLIAMGHTELFTKEMKRDYLAWVSLGEYYRDEI